MNPDIAQIMWDAYRAQSDATASDRNPQPIWDALDSGTRLRWEAAALAATSALTKPLATDHAGRYSCDCLMPCALKDCPGWAPRHR